MNSIAVLINQINMFVKSRKGTFLLVSYTLCFLLYLVIGGVFFRLIEGHQIDQLQKDILDIKPKIMKKYPNIPGGALDDYLNELRALGVRGLPDPKSGIIEWTFADAVFFCATLLTTIGYGHIFPKSNLGKFICIVYTGFGIPLTLFFLASYVDRLMKISESYKATLFRKLNGMLKPFYVRFVHFTTIMALILLLCFLVPAFVFAHYEKGWGVFDGIYFCFISLTTVGLGDMVPALDPEMPYVEVYKYGTTLFMIAGITIMTFMMALAADFHHNYNCSYQSLPYTISSEKISINPNSVASYGSILSESGKSENGNIEKIIQP